MSGLPHIHRPALRSSLAALRSMASSATRREKTHWAVPSGSWDAHIHVADFERFPLGKNTGAKYSPHSATLDEAQQNARKLSIPNLVFVQTSTYGFDNSWLLWCLEQMGPAHSRGVVVLDPAAEQTPDLHKWNELGVRGVRLNLKSVDVELAEEELRKALVQLQQQIKGQRQWAIHTYADMSSMEHLKDIVPDLGCKICIDHMGSPPKGFNHEELIRSAHFKALKEMLDANENTFVKISAPYRFHDAENWEEQFETSVRELLKCRNGEAAVFASDWPHTRFESTAIKPWVELCLAWCGDVETRRKLFKENAEVLYDVTEARQAKNSPGP